MLSLEVSHRLQFLSNDPSYRNSFLRCRYSEEYRHLAPNSPCFPLGIPYNFLKFRVHSNDSVNGYVLRYIQL